MHQDQQGWGRRGIDGPSHAEHLPIHPTASPAMGSDALPLWLAAFAALPCTILDGASKRPVLWDFEGESAHFVATATPQLLQPFGIALAEGEIVTIEWQAGATEPTIEISQSKAA